MNLMARIQDGPSLSKLGAQPRSLLEGLIVAALLLFAVPGWSQTWDYMAERERIEDEMSDAERYYVRAHSETRESTLRAVEQVHRFRATDRIYASGGKLSTFIAFVLVSLTDLIQLGVVIAAVLLLRRWWLVIPATAFIGAAMWLPGSTAGPASVWTQLALEARILAAVLTGLVGIVCYRVMASTLFRRSTGAT